MDYNPLDSQPQTYKNRNLNPEIIRKHKSEESIIDRNRLSVHLPSEQNSFVKSADILNSNRNSDTVIDDKYREIYNRNLRKSVESISSGKGYEPVYKNYRYQPQFKPLTAWASTQRHLTLPDSHSNLSLSTMSSYKSFSSANDINDKEFRLSTESAGDTPDPDDDFSTTKTDSIEFKPRISKLYSKTYVTNESNTKVITLNRDSDDYDVIIQNQGLIAKQLSAMYSTMKKNEDEPVSPEMKSLNRRSVTINEGKNTEFFVPDDGGPLYATIGKPAAVEQNGTDDVVTTYELRESIQRVVDGLSLYPDIKTETSTKPVPEQNDLNAEVPPEPIKEPKLDATKPNNDNETQSNGLLPWNWKKKSIKKKDPVIINLHTVEKYFGSNIPKFLATCVKSLHDRDLLKMKGIYRLSPNHDMLKQVMRYAIYDHKYTDIENTTDGILLAGLIKSFFKNLSEPLLKSDAIDAKLEDENFKDKLIVNDLENDMIEELIAIIDSLDAKTREIFLFFVMHIKVVDKYKTENHMDYPNLARILSPCLFYSKDVSSNFDLFILSSNQSMLLQVLFENYKIIFKPELQDKIAALYDCILNPEETNSNINGMIQPTSLDSSSTVNENETNTNSTSNGPTRFSLNFLKPKSHSKKLKAPPPPPVIKVAKSNSKKSKAPPVPAPRAATTNLDATDLNQSSEDLLKENFSFIRNKKINIESVSKQVGTNIPELIYTIVQTLTVQKLNGNEYIYQRNMNNEEMKEFIDMLKRQNEDELKRFNNGCQLAYFLKEYLKLFDPPLLTNPLPDLRVYEQMTSDIAKVNIEFKKYSEYINWIDPVAARDTFVFLIKHLNDVATLQDENMMTPLALAKIWSQCLFGVNSKPEEQVAQILFLEYSITNYKKLFSAEDMILIASYEKAFHDPMNLPLPINEKTTQCCSIS